MRELSFNLEQFQFIEEGSHVIIIRDVATLEAYLNEKGEAWIIASASWLNELFPEKNPDELLAYLEVEADAAYPYDDRLMIFMLMGTD
jgi:hypothetical protein